MKVALESRRVVLGEGEATVGIDVVVGPAEEGGEMNWNC